jgi:hypothetical protein
MPIDNLPKGAVQDIPDARDFSASPILSALPPIDWNTQFSLTSPPNEDQGQSLSCVAQAWSYYHWQLDPKSWSRRNLYCRIFLAQGGAYIRDGGKEIVGSGQETRDEMPDPTPETEAGMRDATGLNIDQEATNKENAYFALPDTSIDGVAAGIANYKGVVFGVTGSNPGWQDLENPRPPVSGETTWGHCLYAMGYHLHNGVKCIIAKSSWCNEVLEHHIKEDYFISGSTFNSWVLIPRKEIMNQAKVVKSKNSATVYLCYPVPSMDYLNQTANLQGIIVPAVIPDTDTL